MIRIDGEQVTIKIKKLEDKPGKEIIIVFDGYEILIDNRCLGKDTETCDKCKLKFRCYTGDAIRINFKDEILNLPLPSSRPTIGEVIQWYLQSKGVDPNLTKIVAYGMIDGEGEK